MVGWVGKFFCIPCYFDLSLIKKNHMIIFNIMTNCFTALETAESVEYAFDKKHSWKDS